MLENTNRVAGELVGEKHLNLAVVGPFRRDRRFQEVFGFRGEGWLHEEV